MNNCLDPVQTLIIHETKSNGEIDLECPRCDSLLKSSTNLNILYTQQTYPFFLIYVQQYFSSITMVESPKIKALPAPV